VAALRARIRCAGMALTTPFCLLLGIEIPILQAAIWPATTPELVAAVGEAGAIGSVAASSRQPTRCSRRSIACAR
jgi:NAD(P)H-dependent flavin oxidoreductase YrpB (nitropropane dioxygenase family)